MLRPVWAEIDLGNFKRNLETVEGLIPASTGILAVVKANAYGIGAVEASRAALTVKKVTGLAVATPEEALELRRAGITCMVLTLGPVTKDATRLLVREDVSLTVTSPENLKAADEAGNSFYRKARVHLKIDTGMSRIGVSPGAELANVLAVFKESPHIDLEGVFTHFSVAGTDKEYTKEQFARFKEAVQQVSASGLKPKYLHAANSAAILDFPESRLDLVRPGIMLYGSYPDPSLAGRAKIYPVLSLKARVSYVKRVPEGTFVGYGKTYRASTDTLIATLPVGYADGYPRLLSNRGSVIIEGKRYPIAGRVCMDQMMVDLGVNTGVRPGDLATLIGSNGGESISVDEVASLSSTISHEVLTGLASRVPRVYV